MTSTENCTQSRVCDPGEVNDDNLHQFFFKILLVLFSFFQRKLVNEGVYMVFS